MVSTNYILFEIKFLNNGGESFIFSTTQADINELLRVLKSEKLILSKILEFDRTKSAFKRVSKQRLLNCIDFNTELHELLK